MILSLSPFTSTFFKRNTTRQYIILGPKVCKKKPSILYIFHELKKHYVEVKSKRKRTYKLQSV